MDQQSKVSQLNIIKANLISDKVCPALAAQATQLVFGAGNANSDIVFIGEAPGKKEDESGLPFVGAAGKFLNEMLALINLKREDIYITNIVKYRPPENRDPLPEEKLAFLPYLQQQLEVIAPRIVVTLGRHAANVFIPELKISQEHAKPQHITLKRSGSNFKIILLPLFHPAAALYNGSMRQMLLDDFALIPAIIHNLSYINENNLVMNKN